MTTPPAADDAPDLGPYSQLACELGTLLEDIVAERRAYYIDQGAALPGRDAIRHITRTYANRSLELARKTKPIPGPWGLAGAIREILNILSHQLRMLFDLGVAYGHSTDLVRRELLLGILLSSVEEETGPLIEEREAELIVRATPEEGFERFVNLLAARISQQLASSIIGRWIPTAGTEALSTWTKRLSQRVEQTADTLLSRALSIGAPEAPEDDGGREPEAEAGLTLAEKDTIRIRALINLMKIDGVTEAREKQYIRPMIEQAPISEALKDELWEAVNSEGLLELDVTPFCGHADDVDVLLSDLIALAHADGRLDAREREYILELGRTLGISLADLTALLDD